MHLSYHSGLVGLVRVGKHYPPYIYVTWHLVGLFSGLVGLVSGSPYASYICMWDNCLCTYPIIVV